MRTSTRTIEFKFERTIPAPPGDVLDAWLNPKIPGNPWNAADKLIFNPEVDGFFYWAIKGTPHYGRFTEIERPGRIQHTWMSPNTSGLESMVTVTFKNQGKGTLMTLVHSGLPDTDGGRGHKNGWNYFLNIFPEQFGDGSRE
ncbi:MAG: SRPBCC family protein [Leptospirales bacterium]